MWFTQIFEDFLELKPIVWAILVALLVLGALLVAGRRKWSARMLTYAAICIALGFILSYIRFYHLPQGGSITMASMLPVMVFSYFFGPLPGIIAGLSYGLLQLLQDFYVVHPLSLMLDYPLAFACLGLAGVLRNRHIRLGRIEFNLPLGILIAGLGRFLCHYISGVAFFGEYAPEGMAPAWYSLVANLSYLGPEIVICLVLVLIPQVRRLIEHLRVNAHARA